MRLGMYGEHRARGDTVGVVVSVDGDTPAFADSDPDGHHGLGHARQRERVVAVELAIRERAGCIDIETARAQHCAEDGRVTGKGGGVRKCPAARRRFHAAAPAAPVGGGVSKADRTDVR